MAAQNSAAKIIASNDHPIASHALALAAFPKSDHVVTVEPLSVGTWGTFQTLEAMAQCVKGQIAPDFSGWRDEYNQRAASLICRNKADEIAALYSFTRDQILYIPHPWNMQTVQDCRRTLELMTGDCVSKSVCLATLLACRGLISRFVAQAPDGVNHDHVYCEVYDGMAWLALDPTADGQDGRPLGAVGWFQVLPDGGFESTGKIF